MYDLDNFLPVNPSITFIGNSSFCLYPPKGMMGWLFPLFPLPSSSRRHNGVASIVSLCPGEVGGLLLAFASFPPLSPSSRKEEGVAFYLPLCSQNLVVMATLYVVSHLFAHFELCSSTSRTILSIWTFPLRCELGVQSYKVKPNG